ncbi:MAG: hypothetical protein AB7P20_25795 [Rhizobiaceae bacterium]
MAMSAAERVRLSRWVNKVEALGDELLSLLQQAPDPLPREPVFSSDLVEILSGFVARDEIEEEDDFPPVRFLSLGNGNQHANRERAMTAFTTLVPGVSRVDHNTVTCPEFGKCHFAAFTHIKGAMISSTRSVDGGFGGAEWHDKGVIVMFRDVGDGRCIVYVNRIEPLFEKRTIGHHGVRWEDVEKLALKKMTLSSARAIEAVDGD